MNYDFIVVGGGPAGVSCAIALGQRGARCLLLERSSGAIWKPGEIISSNIQFPLRELGVWKEFQDCNFLRSSGTRSVWNLPGERSSAIDPYGGAYFICRNLFETMLLESARTVAVQIVRGARVTGVVKNRTRWDVTTTVGKDSIVFQSKLLIDATGRSRAVTGSEKRYVYDNLVAILAYVDAPTSDLRFELEATESGWWYSSALPGAKRVVAFVTDADLLPSGKYPCIQFFKTQLRKSSFSKLITHEPTIRFAATSSTFRQTVAGRAWASLGDAVATYDPLTGFGVPVAVSKGLGLGRILSQVDCDVAFRRYWQAEVEGFTEYLRVRRNLYRRENHWPRSVFWQRRRSQQSLFGQ